MPPPPVAPLRAAARRPAAPAKLAGPPLRAPAPAQPVVRGIRRWPGLMPLTIRHSEEAMLRDTTAAPHGTEPPPETPPIETPPGTP
jgi:hypothetical protein